MGQDPNGFAMDTLITEERRQKMLNSIVDQNDKRMQQFDFAFRKVVNSNGKIASRDYLRAKKNLFELEERHEAQKKLHDKYLSSLEIVLTDKKQTQLERDLEREGYVAGSMELLADKKQEVADPRSVLLKDLLNRKVIPNKYSAFRKRHEDPVKKYSSRS